jgi:hypothetical protein
VTLSNGLSPHVGPDSPSLTLLLLLLLETATDQAFTYPQCRASSKAAHEDLLVLPADNINHMSSLPSSSTAHLALSTWFPLDLGNTFEINLVQLQFTKFCDPNCCSISSKSDILNL